MYTCFIILSTVVINGGTMATLLKWLRLDQMTDDRKYMWNTAAEKLLQRTNLFQETLSGQPFTSEANASNLKKILYSPENNKMEDEPEFDITLAMAQQGYPYVFDVFEF